MNSYHDEVEPNGCASDPEAAAKVFGILYDDVDVSSTNSLSYSPSPNQKTFKNDSVIESSGAAALALTFPPVKAGKENMISASNEKSQKPLDETHSQKKKTPNKVHRGRKTLRDRKCHALCQAKTTTKLSINMSMNAVKESKKLTMTLKKEEAARLRKSRQRTKKEIEAFNAEAEKMRFEVLLMRSQINSDFSKARRDREKKMRHEQIDGLIQESLFKSEVSREHNRILREEQLSRRRESIMKRERVRKNHKEGEDKMKLEKLVEDTIYFDERQATSEALKLSKECDMAQRRKSCSFRNKHAKSIREIEKMLEQKELLAKYESYSMKWSGEKDAEAYRLKMNEERRRSLQIRNNEASKQKAVSRKIRDHDIKKAHESFELKWAAEEDAEEYKRKIDEEKRLSFEFRNSEVSKQMVIERKRQEEEFLKNHDSYELKWAGEKDVEEYKKKIAEERRQSLKYRNAEAVQHKNLEQQMQAIKMRERHESFELKWAGEKDVEEQEKKMAEERRQSLEFRRSEALNQKTIEQKTYLKEMEEKHNAFESKWAGLKDAEYYNNKLEGERRRSLEFRRSEALRGEKIEKQLKTQKMEENHGSYELKWASEKDVEEYKRLTEEERRQSLAFRNSEAQIQRAVSDLCKKDEMDKKHESFEVKWAGDKDAQFHKEQLQKERRLSLEFRNIEAKRQKDLSERMQALELQDRHNSFELKWDGEKDVEEHKKRLKEDERLSFAHNNSEKKRHQAVMDELLSLSKQKESESLYLKWAGEEDAKEYLKREAVKRRESLQLRNVEARIHREMTKNENKKQVEERREEEMLHSLCEFMPFFLNFYILPLTSLKVPKMYRSTSHFVPQQKKHLFKSTGMKQSCKEDWTMDIF